MRRSFHFGIAAGFDDEDGSSDDEGFGFGYSSLLHRRRSRVVNVSCSGLVLRRLAAVVTDVASLHPNDGDDISAFLPSFLYESCRLYVTQDEFPSRVVRLSPISEDGGERSTRMCAIHQSFAL